jgi:hypothetical protein
MLALVIVLRKVLLFYYELKLTVTCRGVDPKTTVMRHRISMAG